MTARTWRRFGTLLAGVMLAAHTDVAVAGLARGRLPVGPLPAHEGRILVKYRSTVAASAHDLLAQGVPFKSVTGRESLDRLNRRLGVRGAKPLFFEQYGGAGQRSAAYLGTVAGEYGECCVWGLGRGRSCAHADGPSEGGGVRPRED